MAPDPLSLAVAAIREWLTAFTAAAWEKSPGITDKDMQTFAARMAPTVAASQIKVANLVTAKVARDHSLRPVPVDEELITLARGVDPIEVYQRPIIAARTALSKGKTFDEARNLGALRARQLCMTDVQMAKVRQYDRSLTDADQKFFRRVPEGPATCAMCLIAATQPYKVGTLMPIHPGCDCGIEQIPAGMNLDHLLDTQRLLEATHAQVKEFTAIEDRGGRAVDYRKLLITKDHGEIGPLLAWNGQAFTGAKDIPGPAADHRAKPQVTKIADESPADRARKLLPGLEKSLADLREKGLSEDSSQVTYHKQQIDKHRAALDAENAKENGGQPPKPPQPPVPPRQNGGVGDSGGDDDFKDHPDLSEEDRAEARAAAQAKREAAAAAEPEVSATLSAAVEATGGQLERFDSRLKDEASLYRKIQDIIADNDVDAETASTWIRDALRYTAVVDEHGYWAAGDRIAAALEEAGYQRAKITRGWNREGYRGRNDSFITPEGQEFELQIHTAASLHAAEVTHGLYEEERLPTTSPERKAQLSAQQYAIFASVPAPDDIVWLD